MVWLIWKFDKEKSEIMKCNYYVKFLNEKDVEFVEVVCVVFEDYYLME